MKLCGYSPLPEPWPCPGGEYIHLPSICLPWGPEDLAGLMVASDSMLAFATDLFALRLCIDPPSREQENRDFEVV